jgi:DNA-binding PucR family transcriptional regulator
MTGSGPSDRIKELIRRGATDVLHAPAEWFEEIDDAAFSTAAFRSVAEDPELRAFTLRGTHAILLHWAAANVDKPGQPVPPNTQESFQTVRLFTYRGFTETIDDGYRLAQDAAWRRWMQIAFGLTSDADELREMLDITARSISEFVTATIASNAVQIEKERALLKRGGDSERREMILLLLNGGPVSRDSAEQTLGYRLAQQHTAAVVWTTQAAPRLADLEQVADALARHARAAGRLRLVASPGTVWVWLAGADVARLQTADQAVDAHADMQVAIGSTGAGLDGFRVSHLDAIKTQHAMARLYTEHRVGRFAEIEGVLLLTADSDGANRFITNHLGPLASSSSALREAVRVYLQEQGNATGAADRLFTHRNTILRRIKRAEELLPYPLEQNGLNIAMALEILYWRGASAQSAAREGSSG